MTLCPFTLGKDVRGCHRYHSLLYGIYRYLSLLANDPIDIEDVVRISVENKMCDERGALVDTFNVPQYLIYDKMNEVCVVDDSVADFYGH